MRTKKGKITEKVKDPNVRNPPDGHATTAVKRVTGKVTARRNGCEFFFVNKRGGVHFEAQVYCDKKVARKHHAKIPRHAKSYAGREIFGEGLSLLVFNDW